MRRSLFVLVSLKQTLVTFTTLAHCLVLYPTFTEYLKLQNSKVETLRMRSLNFWSKCPKIYHRPSWIVLPNPLNEDLRLYTPPFLTHITRFMLTSLVSYIVGLTILLTCRTFYAMWVRKVYERRPQSNYANELYDSPFLTPERVDKFQHRVFDHFLSVQTASGKCTVSDLRVVMRRSFFCAY